MKLGILGGTFNPIHLGHLRIAEEVRDRLQLDRVLFMPAATPPHKPLAGDLPFTERLAMVQLAIADHPDFSATDLENRRGGPSYSVDTLAELQREYPEDELYFIIGSDSFLEFGLWHRYEEIFPRCHLAVVERPGAPIPDLPSALPPAVAGAFTRDSDANLLTHRSGTHIIYLPGIPLAISSSAIRAMAARGESLRYLVPPAVNEYITTKRIYTNAG
jgi:nicotinate-nucleotide adenylyltransferase